MKIVVCGRLKIRLSFINLLKGERTPSPHAPYLYPQLSLDYNRIALGHLQNHITVQKFGECNP